MIRDKAKCATMMVSGTIPSEAMMTVTITTMMMTTITGSTSADNDQVTITVIAVTQASPILTPQGRELRLHPLRLRSEPRLS